MKRKRPLALLCAALAVAALAAGCTGGQAPPAPSDRPAQSQSGAQPASGTAAALGCLKSFSAAALDGSGFTQDDVAAKDVTVVNFWALSCRPCIAEMPELAQLARDLPDNVQVVTVCLDGLGSEDTVRQVLDQAGFDGVTLIAGGGDLAELAGNIRYTPTTVFADSEGTLWGKPIIGGQADLPGTFLAAVNAALRGSGKAEVSLAE